VTLRNQRVTQMRAKKASTSSDNDSHPLSHSRDALQILAHQQTPS
jgi:hypothetical protein